MALKETHLFSARAATATMVKPTAYSAAMVTKEIFFPSRRRPKTVLLWK
jgi:hypothetical protein